MAYNYTSKNYTYIGVAVTLLLVGAAGIFWFAEYRGNDEIEKTVILNFENAVEEFYIDYEKLATNPYNNPGIFVLTERIKENDEKLQDDDPENDRNAYETIAFASRQLGDDEAAILGYRASLSLFANNVFALNNLATSYKAIGDYQSAVGAYEMALEISPGEVRIYQNLADAYRHPDIDKEDMVVPLIELGIRITFDSPDLINYLAVYYQYKGNTEKAIEYFERVLRAVPGSVPVREELKRLKQQ